MSIYMGVKSTFDKFRTKISTLKAKAMFFFISGIQFQSGLCVRGKICIYNRGQLNLGQKVTLNSASWANPIGLGTRTYFQIFHNAIVTIGNNTGLSNSAITSKIKVTIGDNVLIGSGVKIFDTDFHPIESHYRYGQSKDNAKTKSLPVKIDDGVFIGGGSIILKGSNIGKNSIIGAGSVVSGTIPNNEIWAGNPAKYIKKSV